MRYIDYKAMKDFLHNREVCELFEVNMQKCGSIRSNTTTAAAGSNGQVGIFQGACSQTP